MQSLKDATVVLGLLLTLSVEYFYLIDNFRVRMNTIFKFYFQAWVLMAIASAFAIYWLSRWAKARRPAEKAVRAAFLIGFWVLFAMGMVYPVLGNMRRAEDFANPPRLDGTAYLAERTGRAAVGLAEADRLADRGVYTAIDLHRSFTRSEDHLLDAEEIEVVATLRSFSCANPRR